ncbi:hypothetical protein HOD20_04935 [archaeon]|jgi:uncharacterized protein (UPF0333 family)|nr:hypothetical protein [archaeon]MBT4351848.1 hypothetical protein [archaeon]MBT4647619.1 hypothetical protein [archaeon]MBT6822595.1 hypothetical protein [archaeon]MBT7392780.1 hypothetical protein [archaeon]
MNKKSMFFTILFLIILISSILVITPLYFENLEIENNDSNNKIYYSSYDKKSDYKIVSLIEKKKIITCSGYL